MVIWRYGGCAPKATRRSRRAIANLVRHLEVLRPDQVWVADITYVTLRRECVYLTVVMDLFTRAIRGWHLGRTLDAGLTIAALKMALANRRPGIYHSDQGLQYADTGYVALLDGV